jgi:hypothetical protein
MYILFIYNLFKDAVKNSDYAVSNSKMIVNIEFERLWLEAPVRWVPCHHDMTRPQVADGGDGL